MWSSASDLLGVDILRWREKSFLKALVDEVPTGGTAWLPACVAEVLTGHTVSPEFDE